MAQGRSSTRPSVEHRSRAAVAPEPADGAVEPASSGASLGVSTEPVSEEPVAPMVAPLDGEIEELQLGTADNDLPELKDSEP